MKLLNILEEILQETGYLYKQIYLYRLNPIINQSIIWPNVF